MSEYNDYTEIQVKDIAQGVVYAVTMNSGEIYRGEVLSVERLNDDSVLKFKILSKELFRQLTIYADQVQRLQLTVPVQHTAEPTRKTQPNELHYTDVMGEANMMKVGNAYNGSGEIVKEFTLEANGMVVVHGQNGIIAVIKSDRIELYYS